MERYIVIPCLALGFAVMKSLLYRMKKRYFIAGECFIAAIGLALYYCNYEILAKGILFVILGTIAYVLIFYLQRRIVENTAFREITEKASEPMIIFDRKGRFIAANYEAKKLFGNIRYGFEQSEFCRQYDLYQPKLLDQSYRKKTKITCKGEELYFDCKYIELRDKDYRTYASYFVFTDITNITRANNEISYMETHDELTGLYNIKRFYEKSAEVLQKYPQQKFVIILFNISRFKVINDMFGRAMGDYILQQIADDCLKQCSNRRVYARVDSDNFVALCPEAELVIDALSVKRNVKITHNNITCTVHLRYGIYEIDNRNLPVAAMCDRARMALYSIKSNGNTIAAVYNDQLRKKIVKEHIYKEELNDALARGEFKIYLQPQVRCADNEIKGAEALVRWKHHEMGIIPPSEFIEFFEKNGLITTLDMHIWDRVCRMLQEWKAQGKEDYIAVNISMKDFYIVDLYKVFTSLVEKYEIDKTKLHLEITESAFTLDLEKNVKVIKKLQEYGFIVEMDDFGSGYSSLNVLKSIPVNVIKLDMKFVEETDDNERADTIIRMVIAMANELKMDVVAEGVETKEQADKLKRHGCAFIQGYLYAKPMPADNYATFIDEFRRSAG